VKLVSIVGRLGQLDELEAALQESHPELSLRKSETDLSDDYVSTENLLQVIIWALYSNLTGSLPSLRLARLPSTLAGSRFCALLTGYCRIDAKGCVSVDFQARSSQKLLSTGCENGRAEVRMRA